ncbi:MAG: GtrA family protein [Massilia sp.]
MVFGRYLAVGLAATGVHYLVLYLLVERFGWAPPFAAAFGAICGALAAYLGNWRFTFAGAAGHGHALPRFLAVAAGGALVNWLVVWIGSSVLGMHYFLAQVVASALVVFMTFQINRVWTFQ